MIGTQHRFDLPWTARRPSSLVGRGLVCLVGLTTFAVAMSIVVWNSLAVLDALALGGDGLWSAARVLGGGVIGLLSLLLAYRSLVYLVNRSQVCVADDEVLVEHGPLPWPRQPRSVWRRVRKAYMRPAGTRWSVMLSIEGAADQEIASSSDRRATEQVCRELRATLTPPSLRARRGQAERAPQPS